MNQFILKLYVMYTIQKWVLLEKIEDKLKLKGGQK